MIPIVPGLQCNAWQNMSNAGRWSTIRNLEKQLAAQEQRPAAEVLPMPEKMRQLDQNGQPQVLGAYVGASNAIYVEPTLVAQPQPYAAVETTLHEARHAYQDHAIATPAYHDDPQQVEDWRVNNEPNVYYSGDPNETDPNQQQVDYSLYRWQPVEDDAAKTARALTDELYEGQLDNEPGYAEYKAKREQEMAWDRRQAEATLGTNQVEEMGRLATYERHEQSLTEQSGQEAAQGPGFDSEMTPGGTSPPQNEFEQEDARESAQQEVNPAATNQHAEGDTSEVSQRQTTEPDTVKQREGAVEPEVGRTQQETMVPETPETREQTTTPEADAAQRTTQPQETARAQTGVEHQTATPQQDERTAQNSDQQQPDQSTEQASIESAGSDTSVSEAADQGYDYGYGY